MNIYMPADKQNQAEDSMGPEEIPGHEGHEIVKDNFAALSGVIRTKSGNLFCLTCKEPIEYEG